jgi:hypothetical protein
MPRRLLIVAFTGILIAMIGLDAAAWLQGDPLLAAQRLWPDPWVKAGGMDAVFALATIYIWIAIREGRAGSRVLWLCLIAATGTIATSAYILIQLLLLEPSQPVSSLFLRTDSRVPMPPR